MIAWLKQGYNTLKALAAAVAILASVVGGANYIATADDVRKAEERVNKRIDFNYDATRLKTLEDLSAQYDIILRKSPADREARAAKKKIDKEKAETLDRVVKAK